MGIVVEFNPDLALRESLAEGRRPEECLPKRLEAGETYTFLKKGLRTYWFEGQVPLMITLGDQRLSRPIASVTILEATHFKDEHGLWTRGKYLVHEVYEPGDKIVHFEAMRKI